MQSELTGATKEVTVTLTEEEETLPRPPMIVFYGLNGILNFYSVFVNQWRKQSLLMKPKVMSQINEEFKSQSIFAPGPQANKVQPQPIKVLQPSQVPVNQLLKDLDLDSPELKPQDGKKLFSWDQGIASANLQMDSKKT